MAFGRHALHIGHIIAPLQCRRRAPPRLGPGAELVRRLALARPIVPLECLQGHARMRQDQDTGASRGVAQAVMSNRMPGTRLSLRVRMGLASLL